MTNKTNRIKKIRGLSKVTSFTIHHVYSYREVPMFSLNLLKRTLWLFLLNLVTSGLFQVGLVACQYGNDRMRQKMFGNSVGFGLNVSFVD